MSGSLLTPINVNSRLETAGAPNVGNDLEALHKAIVDHNFLLAEQISVQLMQNRGTKDTFICNISEQDFGPLDMWHFMAAVFIEGKKVGQPYAIHRIVPHTDHMDLGDMRSLDVPIASYDCAVDICDKFNGHIGRGSFSGLFVIGGGRSTPTQQELDDAEKKFLSWQLALVREGDRYFDLKRTADISDLHRNACKKLNLKKAWLPEMSLAASCPACGSDIRSGIAICPNCHVVLDAERAARFTFADGRQAQQQPTPAATALADEPDLMSEPEDEVLVPEVSKPALRQR